MKYLPDILAFSGLCLLGYGLYLFDPRVSFSVCGIILLILGVIGAIKRGNMAKTGEESPE